jgi:hypothetical protein
MSKLAGVGIVGMLLLLGGCQDKKDDRHGQDGRDVTGPPVIVSDGSLWVHSMNGWLPDNGHAIVPGPKGAQLVTGKCGFSSGESATFSYDGNPPADITPSYAALVITLTFNNQPVTINVTQSSIVIYDPNGSFPSGNDRKDSTGSSVSHVNIHGHTSADIDQEIKQHFALSFCYQK